MSHGCGSVNGMLGSEGESVCLPHFTAAGRRTARRIGARPTGPFADGIQKALGAIKEGGAWVVTKRLLYCVKVNRTSLDHLLLGVGADIDEMSHGWSIARRAAAYDGLVAMGAVRAGRRRVGRGWWRRGRWRLTLHRRRISSAGSR